jgi:hypothetical protein
MYSYSNSQCPLRLTVWHRPRDAEKLKLNSEGGNPDNTKYKRGDGDANVGVWWSRSLLGIWSQAVCFVLVRLAGIWLQSP